MGWIYYGVRLEGVPGLHDIAQPPGLASGCHAHGHFSTLAVSQLVCKVSIDLLTLAGLSANISMDRPANLGMCTVSLQTCRPWQVYGQFSDRVDLV